MLPINQKIFAPVKGKVLASYWVKNKSTPFAEGIGGVVVMEANIQDLDVPSDYKKFIYLFKDNATRRAKYIKNKVGQVYKVPKMTIMVDHKVGEQFKDNLATVEDYNAYIATVANKSKGKRKERDKANVDKIHTNENKILLSFMHLSKNSPDVLEGASHVKDITWTTKGKTPHDYVLRITKNISYDHPRVVKKGELIGYCGTILDNGGWAPHVHVNIYSSITSLFRRSERYKLDIWLKKDGEADDDFNKREQRVLKRVWATLKPAGVQQESTNLPRSDIKLKRSEEVRKMILRGYIDPNNIYQLYNSDTKIVKL